MAGYSGGVQIGQVLDEIHDYGVWETEAVFTSAVQQEGVLDVITPISFGSTLTTPNGLVQYDSATDTFNLLKSGPYMFKTRARAARVGGSAGESEIFLQAQISLDTGTSWLPTGESVDLKLDDNKQVEIFFDFAMGFFPTGVQLRQVFARSSSGTDFGSLIPGTPSAALTAAGVQDAPAAQVTLYKLRDYNYV